MVYLDETVCEDGGNRKEVERRLQAGAATRRGKYYLGQLTKELEGQFGHMGWEHQETRREATGSREQLGSENM